MVLQNLGPVTHDEDVVEGGLPVEQPHVAVHHLTLNRVPHAEVVCVEQKKGSFQAHNKPEGLVLQNPGPVTYDGDALEGGQSVEQHHAAIHHVTFYHVPHT